MALISEDIVSVNVDLLHPELLSKEELIKILEQRHMKHVDLYTQEKTQLLIIFHDYIVPQPQRVYRENRRGRFMSKERQKQESIRDSLKKEQDGLKTGKHKSNTTDTTHDEPKSKHPRISFQDESSTPKSSPFTDRLKSPPNLDRLKPPPSLERLKPPPTSDKKVIKVSSGSSSSSSEAESSGTNGSKVSSGDTCAVPTRKTVITLINKTLQSAADQAEASKSTKLTSVKRESTTKDKETPTTDSSEPKKHKKITWP